MCVHTKNTICENSYSAKCHEYGNHEIWKREIYRKIKLDIKLNNREMKNAFFISLSFSLY